MIELLTVLLRIRKVSVSKLGPETGYLTEGFLDFSVPPNEYWDILN
jgi:hypothetical protein